MAKEFLKKLKTDFGTTEEFGQFERDFYAQKEEVGMLRKSVDSLRGAVTKLQEEKRELQLQLVSEKASREQDSKNALTQLETNKMQVNAQIYSIKCEAETWKRKAEAMHKESDWLKEQLKTLELEKTEAMRKIENLTRLNFGVDQHRMVINDYLKRHKDSMTDVQRGLLDLEKARESYAALVEATEKQLKLMTVNLKNKEKAHILSETRVQELEQELIAVKGKLVQNNAELIRTQTVQMRTEQLVNKLVVENKDLHTGFTSVITAMNETELEHVDLDKLQHIPRVHDEIMKDVEVLKIDGNS